MKSVGFNTFSSLRKNEEIFNDSINYYGWGLRENEYYDFNELIKILKKETNRDFLGWFLGVNINLVPDFDAVKFYEKSAVIFELKASGRTEAFDNAKITFEKQNKILKSLGIETIYDFLFVEEEKEIFKFKNNVLKKIEPEKVIEVLEKFDGESKNILENLEPKSFLVNPFENTDKFFRGEYFLNTNQQRVVENIKQKKGLVAVSGTAGTGKTLIAYDLIREWDKNKKIIFIFTGDIRDEHKKIEEKLFNTKFVSIKNFNKSENLDNLDEYDVVIIDEAQRMRSNQRRIFFPYFQNNKDSEKVILTLFDSRQSLGPKELDIAFENAIQNLVSIFTLKNNVRSNKFVSGFIDWIFKINNEPNDQTIKNDLKKYVDIQYFDNAESSKEWIESKQEEGYSFLTPTEANYGYSSSEKFSTFSGKKNVHKVIGSETEKVVTYLDENFYYDDKNNLLDRNNEYYYLNHALFVNLSRAQSRISLAVINNSEIYKKIMSTMFK